MIRIASWPRSWNWRSFRRIIEWPRCRSGLVGSTPSLTRSGRPRASFARNSASLMICAAPCLRIERASSGCMVRGVSFVAGKLLTLVQQFAHLLDRERFVLGLQRFLAFALPEERPVAGIIAHCSGFAALRRDPGARGDGRRCDYRIGFR